MRGSVILSLVLAACGGAPIHTEPTPRAAVIVATPVAVAQERESPPTMAERVAAGAEPMAVARDFYLEFVRRAGRDPKFTRAVRHARTRIWALNAALPMPPEMFRQIEEARRAQAAMQEMQRAAAAADH